MTVCLTAASVEAAVCKIEECKSLSVTKMEHSNWLAMGKWMINVEMMLLVFAAITVIQC